MSVFLDTSVIYAHHDEDATRHDVAAGAMDRILTGRYGQPITTDYIYNEALTLTLSRTNDVESAKRLGRRLRGSGPFPEAIDLRVIGSEGFRNAVAVYERYDDHGLSFTEASIVAHVESQDVDYVLSFDSGLDGLVERLVPRTV